MNKPPHSYLKDFYRRSRGSTLVVVLILAMVLGVFLASIMSRGQNELLLTERNMRLHEALNAAESIGNYGIAEIVRRYATRAFLPVDEFSVNPLKIPATDFFDDTRVKASYNELIAGPVKPPVRTYIPDDSANLYDPLKGSLVDSVNVSVYSRALSNPILQSKNPAIGFLEQTLKVRYVNLTDALFYNMDLELHPGPTMEFKGKVHCNRDLYVIADSGLTFYNTVTAAGKILHLYKLRGAQSSAHRGDVRFVRSKEPLSFSGMKLNDSNTDNSWVYNREGNPEWATESQKRWNGNVMDEAQRVPTRNPAGIPDYEPDDPTTEENELLNSAYAVIEPLLPSGHVNRKSSAGRHQKFHARACLVFKVEVLPAGDPRYNASVGGIYVTAYTWDRVNTSIPINSQSPFDGNMKIDPTTGNPIKVPVYLPPGLIGAMASNGTAAGTSSPPSRRVVQYYDSATDSVANWSTATYIQQAGDDNIPELYQTAGGKVSRGMRDLRQSLNLSPITLDVHRLRELVDERAHPSRTADEMADFWIDPADLTRTVTFDPKTQWNGVVYVEFPIVASAPRSDNIVGADVVGFGSQNLNLSLQVVHGETIPNAPVLTDTSVVASSRYANPNQGFTIATNAPLYLIGNYNSDGQQSTGESDQPDTWFDAKGRPYVEPPAGIACDSFTILSRNWVRGAQDLNENGVSDFGGFVDNREDSNNNTVSLRPANFTEISASVITGLIPTIPNSTSISGGAHNFPRFLEQWGNDVRLRLRTSLNALFESEAHTRPMPESQNYYTPPFRNWGQPDLLDNPTLAMIPPGWIQVLDFRMGSTRRLSYEEYESVVGPLR